MIIQVLPFKQNKGVMFTSIKHQLLNGRFLQSDRGIFDFAESQMLKAKQSFLEMNEQLKDDLTQSTNRRIKIEEEISSIEETNYVVQSDYHSINNKNKVTYSLLVVLLLSEWLLNYFSLRAAIATPGLLMDLLRVPSALLLTGGAFYLFKGFYERIMPIVRYGETPDVSSFKVHFKPTVIYSMLSIGIEFPIGYFAHLRAVDIEGAAGGPIYWAFLLLSLLLPAIGGLIWWERLKFIDPLKNAKKLKSFRTSKTQLEIKIENTQSKLDSLSDYYSNFFWNKYYDFMVFKRSYNSVRNVEEVIEDGSYYSSYSNFKSEFELRVERSLKT